MKIKITEKSIKLNVSGKLQIFSEGDQVTVSDEVGNLACQHGWANDVDGIVKTGKRKAGVSTIKPDTLSQDIK